MKVKQNHKEYLDFLISLKKDFKIRESVNYAEIVNSNGEKVISTKNNKFVKGLYICYGQKRYKKIYRGTRLYYPL